MNIIDVLQSKTKDLTLDQLKESLKILKGKVGPEVAYTWQAVINEMELRMGEDAFWLWADAGDLV